MDEMENQAAVEALEEIMQVLDKHSMRKPQQNQEQTRSAELEIELDGDPTEELAEQSPPYPEEKPQGEPDAVRVAEFMTPRKRGEPPQEREQKRGPGRPRKAR